MGNTKFTNKTVTLAGTSKLVFPDGAEPQVSVDNEHMGLGITTEPELTISRTLTSYSSTAFAFIANLWSRLVVDPVANTGFQTIAAIAAEVRSAVGNAKSLYQLIGSHMTVSHRGTGLLEEMYGFYTRISNTASAAMYIVAGAIFYVNNSGSGSMDDVAGSASIVTNSGTATMALAKGFEATVQNNAAGATITEARGVSVKMASDAGTVTTQNGILIEQPSTNAGCVNNYGLYIRRQDTVGSSNSYNLYSAGSSTKNKFEGHVILTGLPTANPGVVGELWNDAGTLKISAG